MKLLTISFGNNSYDGKGRDWDGLSKQAVRRHWNVPEDATTVWLVLHDSPALDRVGVKVRKEGVENLCNIYTSPGFRYYGDWGTPNYIGCHAKEVSVALIKQLENKPSCKIYVECWYEERTK